MPAIFAAKYALLRPVTTPFAPLPDDLASAHAMILAQRAALIAAQSEAKVGALEIERLKLLLAKARREQFGQSSERGKLLVEQLELAIENLEETQAEEETKAEIAAPKAAAQTRQRAPRGPRKLPDNLPVERVVEPAPCACGKCGGLRLRKLGEVVSKTLECEPRRWKIVERVREKFACRDCEAITEPPAPSHPIPRGFAGPSLLAMILVGKFADHQPLNRQSAAFAREGVEIDTSTLADWIGACVAALDPVLAKLRRHVLAAERLHVDDTTVPVLAKTKTRTGRLWTYVRDDRPFGGADPPAAFYDYSPSRHGEHPRRVLADWSGVMQADAFSGYYALYAEDRKPAPIVEAACRVGGDVTIPAPHRPGRADYPHPVLHAQASLRRRRRCERATVEAADVARAWRQNATTTNCCGDRVGRAISSKFARVGGDTNGAAGCCPRCHSRRSAPGSCETGGRAARETGGAGFAGTIRSRRPRRARNGLSPLSGAPRPCLSATCPRRG